MKTAYLYVRVSTDEQKRKGFSLVEQEDRLVKYCELNGIKIRGIYREDFSAKDFNRPEWKKLIKTLRKNKHRPQENVLFIKWDRFSRSIEYAYQMIRTLKDLNVQPVAIDQPIDLDVPESIVMLAVYLAIPEAENCRRGLTTSDGIRRARKMGRWPGKAPVGYANLTSLDGKKFIMPKQPEAEHIKWAFRQLATGSYTISQVRKMASINGFHCSSNNFWKLVHNPIYCGIVRIPANRNEEEQFVKAIHEPLIPESLFHDVQLIITKDRNKRCTRDATKILFPLRGILPCPWCGRIMTGSVSQGKCSKHPYYHCSSYRCKGRFRAGMVNANYEEQLKKVHLRPAAYELFNLILEDENVFTERREHVDERKEILSEISKQESKMSKTRKYFLDEKIEFDDFCILKKEHNEALNQLNQRLSTVTRKLINCDENNSVFECTGLNILQSYNAQDIKGKRDIISLLKPTAISSVTRELAPLEIDNILSSILEVF